MEIIQIWESANTSINSKKLPAISKKVKWKDYRGKKVLDFGGGKFNNFKEWLYKEFNIDLLIYDKFNRSELENIDALKSLNNGEVSLIICSNVLNVIKEDLIIKDIIKTVEGGKVPFIFTVYEGNRTGEGKPTKKDCYQRNQKLKEYQKFFTVNTIIKNNAIYSI